MTGSDMRAFREAMGWKHGKLIAFLRLSGSRASEFIHNMESDKVDISGPIQTAIYEHAARHGLTLHAGQWTRIETLPNNSTHAT